MTRTTRNSLLILAPLALFAAGCGSSSGGGSTASGATAAPINSAQESQVLVGLDISPSEDLTLDMNLGAAFQILVDGYYQDGPRDLTRDVQYQIADDSVLTISGDGLITPLAPGTTTITVQMTSMNGQSFGATKTVTVTPNTTSPAANFVELTLYPKARTLKRVDSTKGVDQLQQVIVVGKDDTGRVWDLTRSMAIQVTDFNSPDRAPSMAGQISPEGLFRGIVGPNEVLLVSRLDTFGLVAGGHIVVGPGQAKPVPSSALYSGAPLAGSQNPIDRAVLAELSKQFIEPSELTDDGAFLRRLYADALGRLPTETEYATFLNSSSQTKRNDEIDRLVNSAAFADQWGKLIGEWFVMANTQFDGWVEAEILAGNGLDSIVSDMITGTGTGGMLFDQQHATAADKVNILLKASAGMTAECAQCHDHPVTGPSDTIRWTQDERYPLDAFFAMNADEATKLNRDNVRFGAPLDPGFILDPSATVTTTLTSPLAQRRAEFAGLFTASSQFNRGLAHRIFAHLATPLLDPNQFLAKELDAVTVPGVLDALTAEFAAQNSSVQDFVAMIFKSNYYQLSSKADDTTNDDLLARRTLSRHQSEACESLVENVTGLSLGGGRGFFRQTFGFPLDRATIDERTTRVNMSQSLVLMNSPIVQDLVSDNGSRVAQLASDVAGGSSTVEDAVKVLFRSALSREPESGELTLCVSAVNGAANTREGLEDVAAVLMSSIEAVSR